MKKYVLAFMILSSCTYKSSDNKIDDDSPQIMLNLNHIYINQYENDSLNLNRPYVFPIIYFHLEAINTTDELLSMVINSVHEDLEPLKLVLKFNFFGKVDTLRVTNFETSNVFSFSPRDTTFFAVNVIVEDFLNQNDSISRVGILKEIASTAELYYLPNLIDTLYIDRNEVILNSIKVKKGNYFNIEFRDPEDTTIE